MTDSPSWARTKTIPTSPSERLMVQLCNLLALYVGPIVQGPAATVWFSGGRGWADTDLAANRARPRAILGGGGGGSRTSHWQTRAPRCRSRMSRWIWLL